MVESTIVRVEATEGRPFTLARAGARAKEELQKVGKVIRPKKNQPAVLNPEAQDVGKPLRPLTPLYLFDSPADFVPEPGKKYGLLSYRGQEKDDTYAA